MFNEGYKKFSWQTNDILGDDICKKTTAGNQNKTRIFNQRKKKRNANRDVNKGLELAITQRVNKDKILE